MKRFSQRKGYKPVSEIIQTDGMSDELRNSLWNVLDETLWSTEGYVFRYSGKPGIEYFSRALWFDYFKKPIDSRPIFQGLYDNVFKEIRDYFFNCNWFEVYDFIEFLVQYYKDRRNITNAINIILERELAGYKIIEGVVSGITDKQEVQMLEEALRDTRFQGVTAHLRQALELFSDRENPDYRNSIKESISAVESMAKIITDNSKASLGEALRILEKDGRLHPALKEGFTKLYGYTSDQGGIRHAMLKEPDIDSHNAKFFLLSCTSFVNYLKSRMS
jgi:hypothetical protein